MIIKEITLNSGAIVACHVLTAIALKRPFDMVRVTVQSYGTEAAYAAAAPYARTEDYFMPMDAAPPSDTLEAAVERWLLETQFDGGYIAEDMSDTIEFWRDRAWERIKRARDAAEVADFEYDGNVYQGNKVNITGTALAAKIVTDAGGPFAAEFTLSNDTSVELDGPHAIGLGMEFLARIEAVHARGRTKRAAVYAATTQPQLDAITWFSEE